MKKLLAYILTLIMIIQVLPQSLFESDAKAVVVMEKGKGVEDKVKEKDGKDNKVAAVHQLDFAYITDDPARSLHYHSPLVISPAKDIHTPPPDIC